MRGALALLAGTIVSGLVVAMVELAAHAALTGEPVFHVVILAYALAAAAGTWVALRMARVTRAWVPAAIGLLLAALALENVRTFPHPIWFAPAGAAAIALGAWMAWRHASAGAPRSARAQVRG